MCVYIAFFLLLFYFSRSPLIGNCIKQNKTGHKWKTKTAPHFLLSFAFSAQFHCNLISTRLCTCFNHTLYAFNNNIRRRTKQLNGVRFSDIKSNKRTIFGDLNYEWIKWLATNKHMEFRWQIIEKFKSFNSIIGKINKLKKHTQRTKTFSVLETTRERNKNRTAAKIHNHTPYIYTNMYTQT